MQEPQTTRIFLSSTATDLEAHRRAVLETLQRMDITVVAMESFGARSTPPVEWCTGRAAAADALVVIVAHRYGWVPPEEQGGDSERSITWLEVEAAEAAGKPVFAFLVDSDAMWTQAREQDRLLAAGDDSSRIGEIVRAVQGLQAFRDDLKQRYVIDRFSTPDDLARKVASSLHSWDRERRGHRAAATVAPVTGTAGYLADVLAETSRIDIRGIASAGGAGRQALSYAIEDLYTPLRTTRPGMLTGTGDRSAPAAAGLEMLRGGERVELKELLATHRRLLLVGAPGGGKTTFLRLIACVLARDLMGEERPDHAPERDRHLGLPLDEPAELPVFIRLAALAERMDRHAGRVEGDTAPWLEDYLAALHGDQTAALLADHLDRGAAVLLLDGLDEVAEASLRERLRKVVAAVLRRWGDNRLVLTTRPHGYQEFADLSGMASATIDDFGDREIEEFVRRWVRAFDTEQTTRRGRSYRDELRHALVTAPSIRRLARSPVMLTCLCVVHWNEMRLPEGKADLMSAVLRWLLGSRDGRRQARGYTSAFAQECFKALALAMTDHPDGKRAVVDLAWAAEQLRQPFATMRDITDPRQLRGEGIRFLEYEALDSGFVDRVGRGEIRFWHLTFQEHCAALAMVELGDEDGPEGWWAVLRPHLFDRQWDEVLDHFAGCLARTGRRRLDLLVGRVLELGETGELADIARVVGATGRILQVLALYDYRPTRQLGWHRTRDEVLAIFEPQGAARVPVQTRIAAAEALAQGGDPRFSRPTANLLQIPGLPGAQLGRYPVTVLEYARFVEAGGYDDGPWWDGEGREARENNDWKSPARWDEQLQHGNRPVVGVSWYEADAYCRWLAIRTAQPFRLPTEAEWSAAAHNDRGPYPWGDEEPTPEIVNFATGRPKKDEDDSWPYTPQVGHPTPVGIYPRGASPGGHLDLAGNVWEWCEEDVTEEHRGWARDVAEMFDKEGKTELAEMFRTGALRALRGGGWGDPAQALRSASRFWYPAEDRNDGFGFRVSCGPASTDSS